MKHIQFLPWVGENYTKGVVPGRRLLVLGESHYCGSADAVPQITCNVIADFLDPSSGHEAYKNTFTKFERALAGKPLSADEKKALWNTVLFYNYVQVPISGPRVAPTVQDFANSAPAFFELLETFRPDCVIAWGNRLYSNLPNQGKRLPDLRLPDGDSFETWGYNLSDGRWVRVLPIMHPSASRFVPSYWHKVITAFLEEKEP